MSQPISVQDKPHRNLDSGEKCVTWCQARCYMGEITRAQICALVKNLLSAECSHEDEVRDSCDKALSPVIMFIP